MIRFKLLLLWTAFLGIPAAAAEAPIQMMVLGTYHFENPGLDTNDIKVDSVLTPAQQRQLDAVAKALLVFRPTHVMVEMRSDSAQSAVEQFREFQRDRLLSESNEVVQLGFRIAKMAGISVVNGIDIQLKAGEPDYYSYDAVQQTAAKFSQTPLLAAANAPVAA